MSVNMDFQTRSKAALVDKQLQAALAHAAPGFVLKRRNARAALPEFDALRDAAKAMKDRVLAELDTHLLAFEAKAIAQGSQVHWAKDAQEAREIVRKICQDADAKIITKGKSMISEEIHLNAALEQDGYEVVETDLGEYIIQLRDETPSHIIAPAVHLNKAQVADSFRQAHLELPQNRDLNSRESLVTEARHILRKAFVTADVGITGANLLIAETGQTVIVTNEGNGDLTQSCAKVHIALTSIEKVVPSLDDASLILRLLGRSATGQEMSVYTTFSSGARRAEDPDGPEQMHVILLDNGRSDLYAGALREMLRCIRCGACINHCPVYQSIGGHAYGAIYPGPMGSVLSPALMGLKEHSPMPNASTFCGRCADVCPMRIPLPDLMRKHREQAFEIQATSVKSRWALWFWSIFVKHPKLYRLASSGMAKTFYKARFLRSGKVALPGLKEWTKHRHFPASEGQSFVQAWQQKQQKQQKQQQE